MPSERRAYILRLLESRGRIRTAALARELNVTDETIRTDLVSLHKKGLLRRVHGGAIYTIPPLNPGKSATARLDVHIADIIAQHIPPGSTIAVDPSPLILALAAALRHHPCTFITNSPELLCKLTPRALPHHVICPGGKLDKKTGLITPFDTEQTLAQHPPQLAILCPQGVHPDHLNYSAATRLHWASLITQHAQCSIVATRSAALDQTTKHTLALTPDYLITEDNLPDTFSRLSPQTRLITVPFISAESLGAANDDWEI